MLPLFPFLVAMLPATVFAAEKASAPPVEPLTSVFANTCVKSLGKPAELARRLTGMGAPVVTPEQLRSQWGAAWSQGWNVPSEATSKGYLVALREGACMVRADEGQQREMLAADFQQLFGPSTIPEAVRAQVGRMLATALPSYAIDLYSKPLVNSTQVAIIALLRHRTEPGASALVITVPDF